MLMRAMVVPSRKGAIRAKCRDPLELPFDPLELPFDDRLTVGLQLLLVALRDAVECRDNRTGKARCRSSFIGRVLALGTIQNGRTDRRSAIR